ncbi:hypothetical protein [Lactiplantibacillus plantarum]|uniref:hypothetical protein n=1 Tax=Lactiplantibacillus plantarum TaxID=1590 RepID=UPI00223F6C00|nr:hypothetical protein [Lactiplantibacillus plantarum]
MIEFLIKSTPVISPATAIIALLFNMRVSYRNRKSSAINNFKDMFFHLLELLSHSIQLSGVNVDQTLSELKTSADSVLKGKKIKKLNEKQEECSQLLLELENIKLNRDGEEKLTFNTIKKEFSVKDPSKLDRLDHELLFIELVKRERRSFSMDYDEYVGIAKYWKDKLEMNEHKKAEINKKFENIFDTNVSLTLQEKNEVIKDNIKLSQNNQFFEVTSSMVGLMLNEKYIKKSISIYTGILRAQLSEKQLLLLFYYVQYTEQGSKFRLNIAGMNLWGSRDELKPDRPIHFNKDLLIWPDDLETLKREYTSK